MKSLEDGSFNFIWKSNSDQFFSDTTVYLYAEVISFLRRRDVQKYDQNVLIFLWDVEPDKIQRVCL